MAIRRLLLLLLLTISAVCMLTTIFPAASISKCSKSARAFASSSPGRMKHSRIVQAEVPAGRGIPGRVQCGDGGEDRPLRECSRGMDRAVAVVTMFVPPVEDTCDRAMVGNRVMTKLDRSLQVLQAFLESISRAMPRAEKILLVDPDVGFGKQKTVLPAGVSLERIPGNYTRGNLMVQRLESYTAFLELQLQRKSKKHLIFTDSDMIVVEDLGCVFFQDDADFDIGLTFRNNQQQPINSGVIFVRGNRSSLQRAKEFMSSVVKVYRRVYMQASRMMGDQLAFAHIVRKTCSEPADFSFKQGASFRCRLASGLNAAFLPCSLYNWTPSEGAGQFHGMPEEVKVIHFKGSRKRLMLAAWQTQHLQGLASMKCFILRSGRAKYDF